MHFKIEGGGFQSFRDRFEFDFSNRGLLAIQGDNRLSSSSDSNGSGKSSLIEALLWGLFEQTLREIPVDSVINNDLGKDCWVKVTTYLDNGDVLEVNRGRKHKTLKNGVILTLNGGDITKGTVAESNREIETILGCDFKTFASSVYFNGTSAIKPFPLIGDKAIKQVIESALGVEIFDRMADGLSGRRSAATACRAASCPAAAARSTQRTPSSTRPRRRTSHAPSLTCAAALPSAAARASASSCCSVTSSSSARLSAMMRAACGRRAASTRFR